MVKMFFFFSSDIFLDYIESLEICITFRQEDIDGQLAYIFITF